MNGSKPTTSDGKSEVENEAQKSGPPMHISVTQPPVLRRGPEPIKCFTPSIRSTFAPPRPTLAPAQPSTIVSSSSAVTTAASAVSNAQPVITKTGVIQTGNASISPMASIIRSGPPGLTSHTPTSVMPSTYGSHLPRGAAAVANITTLKPAVATPIARSHIISGVVPQQPHLVQPRISGTSTFRGPIPSGTKSLSSLSSDISHISSSTTSNMGATQIVLANSRTNESSLRPAAHTVIHTTAVISKQPSFTSPIASFEKGFYKQTVSPTTLIPVQTTTTTVALTTSHSSTHVATAQPGAPIQSLSVTLPSNLTIPSSGTQIHISPQLHPQLVSHSISLTGTPLGSISPSTVSSNITHTHSNLPKSIPHPGSPMTHFTANSLAIPNRTLKPTPLSTSVVSQSSSKPMVSSSNLIPVAKVHPQPPLAIVSRQPSDVTHGDSIRNSGTATLFVSPTQRGTATHLSVNAAPAPSTSGMVVSSGSTTAGSANVILAESRSERPGVGSYSFPTGSTYFYETVGGVTMHALPGSSAPSHAFTAVPAGIRAGFMTPHPPSTITVQPNVRTTAVTPANVNSVVMTSARAAQIITSLADTTTTSDPSSINVSNSITAVSSSTTSSPATNASSSPRPSILRKRTADGSQVSNAAKRNLLSSLSPSKIPIVEASSSTTSITACVNVAKSFSSNSSERDPAVENGQNVEIVSSTNNTVTSLSVPIKQELVDSTESAALMLTANLLSFGPPSEASPRKKPRKQQLTGNELVETHSTEGEDEFEKEPKEPIKKEIVQEEPSRSSWVPKKNRPPVSLLSSYRHPWKSRHNHYMRYTDVRTKEEKRPTINELANQKFVCQKVNGWKVHHLCAQMDEMVELESSAHTRLATLLEEMQKKSKSKDEGDLDLKVTVELMMGNIQRCKSIRDQMKDAKSQVLKVLDHKARVAEIVSKYMPKPSSRRREKVLY